MKKESSSEVKEGTSESYRQRWEDSSGPKAATTFVLFPSFPIQLFTCLSVLSWMALISGMGLTRPTPVLSNTLKAFLNKGVQISQSTNNWSLKWSTPFYTSHSQGQWHLCLRLSWDWPPARVPRLSLPVLREHFLHLQYANTASPVGRLWSTHTTVSLNLLKTLTLLTSLADSLTARHSRWEDDSQSLSPAQISEVQTPSPVFPLIPQTPQTQQNQLNSHLIQPPIKLLSLWSTFY